MRCVIFAGSDINDYEYVKSTITKDDFLICCDSGLIHMERLGMIPDLCVGDFDSHKEPEKGRYKELIKLPRIKDDTDSFYAVKEAYNRGYRDFLIFGATGRRIDHTLCNVYMLQWLFERGAKGVIADEYCELEVIDKAGVESGVYPFFSLINITGTARHINVSGAKYGLSDGEIKSDYQYGVSNEVLPGETARISVGEGSLLLIKVRKG
ncbi:MAG: thiamine diphosphokinase [Lachnospiraceae bacterium]|nr:thiamine diphosphokinase [Lachnospiraceae bacterium]